MDYRRAGGWTIEQPPALPFCRRAFATLARRLKAGSWWRVRLLAAVVAVGGRAEAQSPPPPSVVPSVPLVVLGRQSLQFGDVLRGLPSTVSRDDMRRAGQFEIRGTNGAEIRIDFLFPSAMVAPETGRGMPLVFGPGDASWSPAPSHRLSVSFDPRQPLVVTLGADEGREEGEMYIRLGGTVVPDKTQPSGRYTATITVTVAEVGI